MLDRLGIRVRIAGGAVLIAALLALAAGLVIDAQIERVVRDGTERALQSDLGFYRTAIRTEPGEPFDAPGPGQSVAVLLPDGSRAVDTLPAALPPPAALADASGAVVRAADGARYVVHVERETAAGGVFRLIAVRSTASEDAVLDQMRIILVVSLSGLVVAIALGATLLTTAALRPVRRLRSTAEVLSEHDTADLLPVGRARDDVRALALTLNGMVARLRAAAARERRFVSDASHELRTPLAILRAQLEVATSVPGDAARLRADLVDVERSADRLERLIESLLVLSRAETGIRDASCSVEELRAEVAAAADRAAFRARAGVAVTLVDELGEAPPAHVRLTVDDAGRLVDNLVSNALATPTPTLEVAIRTASRGVIVSVADAGGGMAATFEHEALQPFRRGRERASSDGVGLGLAIVAALVEAAEGELELDNTPGVGLVVRALLPTGRTADPAESATLA